MCHIKRRIYVDQTGRHKIDRKLYECELHKRGEDCAMTSENEGEIHTTEIRPATSSGNPSRDQTIIVDESGARGSRHRSGRSRMPIGTLILERIGARPKTNREKKRSKRHKDPIEVVVDQADPPVPPPLSSYYDGGAIEDPRQPPPPPSHHPPAAAAEATRQPRVVIVDPPADPPRADAPRRRRRRATTVVHDSRTEHIPASPAEPSRRDQLYRESGEFARSRHDSGIQTFTTASPESVSYSAENDTEYWDRMFARDEARRRQSDEIRKRNEEDRRREQELRREVEDRRQAQIERDRYHASEERQRARQAEELRRREEERREEERRKREERLRREVSIERAHQRREEERRARDEQRRRDESIERVRRRRRRQDEERRRDELAEQERRAHEQRAYDRWRAEQDREERLRWRRRYHDREYIGGRGEPFPDYQEPPYAPPPLRYSHPHGERPSSSYGVHNPSMRYGRAPPAPLEDRPRVVRYHPARGHGYDGRHGTYYYSDATRPGTRIEQRVSTNWWPNRGTLFRRNTYSGGYPAHHRDEERAARRHAWFAW